MDAYQLPANCPPHGFFWFHAGTIALLTPILGALSYVSYKASFPSSSSSSSTTPSPPTSKNHTTAAVTATAEKNGNGKSDNRLGKSAKATFNSASSSTKNIPHKRSLFDHLLGAILVVVLVLIVYTRILDRVPHWLLQPCHILTLLGIITIYWPYKDSAVYHFYLYSTWQGFCGIIGFDEAWYPSTFDLTMFWVQHLAIGLTPFICIASGRFDTVYQKGLVNRLPFMVAVCCFWNFYHLYVLLPASYLTKTDFDNTICPLAGLEFAGSYWREVMATSTYAMAFFFCFVPEQIIKLTRKAILTATTAKKIS